MGFILKLLLTAVAVIVSTYFLPGVHVTGFGAALLVAFVLAILNTFVRPILVLLTIPVTFLTLGLFLLVINALLILLADNLIAGFRVDGFLWAFIFSIILSVTRSFIELIVGK